MVILPAIDLRGGRCVRLRQGRFDTETVFDEDPVAVARRYEAAGAEWLHVVDLDGAREGKPQNLETIRAIRAAVGLKMEVGGGVRTTETADQVLEMGVDRVIVGTRAVQDPDWFREVVKRFPRRIALGLDAKRGLVAVEGWQAEARTTVQEVLERVRDLPLAAIICTDISRDGMMAGPNVETTGAIVKVSPFPVIASGGVTTVKDILRLRETGAWGAVIGRALYEGKLKLEDALAAAAGRLPETDA